MAANPQNVTLPVDLVISHFYTKVPRDAKIIQQGVINQVMICQFQLEVIDLETGEPIIQNCHTFYPFHDVSADLKGKKRRYESSDSSDSDVESIDLNLEVQPKRRRIQNKAKAPQQSTSTSVDPDISLPYSNTSPCYSETESNANPVYELTPGGKYKWTKIYLCERISTAAEFQKDAEVYCRKYLKPPANFESLEAPHIVAERDYFKRRWFESLRRARMARKEEKNKSI